MKKLFLEHLHKQQIVWILLHQKKNKNFEREFKISKGQCIVMEGREKELGGVEEGGTVTRICSMRKGSIFNKSGGGEKEVQEL